MTEQTVSRGSRHRALFLMHNYNDIDHMTPVLDALMQTGRWHCEIVFYPAATFGSVDLARDWRLAYVRDTHAVNTARIEDAAPASRAIVRLFKLRNRLAQLCDATPSIGRLFGRDVRGLLPWFLAWRWYDHLLAWWLTRCSAAGRQLFRRIRPDVVAIDWGRTHNVITPVLSEAKRRGVPVLQLPHGAWTYEGIYSHASQFELAKLAKRLRLPETRADAMVVDNLYKGYRSETQGVDRDHMRFLGLARFTPQWLERLSALPAGTARIESRGKPKVVWFPTWLMACDLDAVDATIAVLEEFSDRLDIVLKVHTRNPTNEMADYGRRLPAGTRIRLVANEVESFAMTRWADLLLITQSSVIYDAFMLGKPVLYLKYTHDFDCMWNVDGVGDTLVDPDALRHALENLAAGRYRPGYDQSAVDRYLKLGVTGGLAPKDVLPDYVALFDQAATGRPLDAGHSFDEMIEIWRQAGRQVVGTEPPRKAA